MTAPEALKLVEDYVLDMTDKSEETLIDATEVLTYIAYLQDCIDRG